jgi:protein TonB
MYADRAKRFSPAGAGAALAVNGALIAGLILAFAPVIMIKTPPPILNTYDVPDDPPPPPPIDEIKPKVDNPSPAPLPFTPKAEVPTHVDPIIPSYPVQPEIKPVINPGTGAGTEVIHETPAPPPLIGAFVDPRYARDFQPEYPGAEIRTGREGMVAVRVLIGADGRVKAIEQVNATSAAFFEATRRQALAHWRFKPATRGGVPQESWKTMTVRFVLSGE